MTNAQINPDGVPIEVDWDKFTVSASVFVPCINTLRASRQVKKITSGMGMQVQIVPRAENKKWGIRIWRTL